MSLDAASRLHLHILITHLAIILAFALPALLLDASWHGLLAQLALTFRAAAGSVAAVALLARHRWQRRSLCLWDEVAVLCALALLCSFLCPEWHVVPVQDPSHLSARQ